MFWGCFGGPEKGTCLFWEKEWDSINSQKYCERIVPLIDGMVSMRPWFSLMQDNATAHTAAISMEDMSQRLIQLIFRPANSPDLNPIEAVWNKMKDYIQRHHPNLGCGKQRTQDSLRNIVKEARDSVSSEDHVRLIQSMPARCQAVVDADGGPTRY
ncbi:Bgt-50335 [Blumeria graminis f. sp. tritici]|uniref:Bgt-50335 n=1 Tax=Blumeria graminis f. sp. tritici TaxID=62690 RepID=A0A9X9QCE2_BLUGR|nr:Bgt-50335 [Blumeria graminis f. sp. tritici]